MAISHFSAPTSGEFVSLAAFTDFGSYPTCAIDQKNSGNIVPQQPSPPTTSDGSPDSFAPGHSDLANMLGDEDEDDGDGESGSEDSGHGKKRHGSTAQANKRGKASSAERRATHNAIERARRESLNGRFLELANALPTMANVKRPSKSVIVNKSLEWIYESQIREHALVRENNALRAELNDMRARLQMPPLSNPPALPLASDVARFKAAGGNINQANGQLNMPMSPASSTPVDSYYGSGAAFAPLGALHHPMQYATLAPSHATSASAPLPRANAFHFSNPFQGFAGPVTSAQPSSPTSKSDSGSDTAASKEKGTNGQVHDVGGTRPLPSVGEAGLCSDGASSVSAVSQVDAIAALQAAHFQQQQFAAFAAAAVVASQAQAQAGQTAPASINWPLGGNFLF